MEIFGIGLPELLLILVLALIVFGPERLPKIARDLGSTLASFRREAEGIRQEFIASMEDVGGPVQDSIQELRSALNIPTRPAPFALPDAGEAASSPSGYSAAANPSAVTTAPTLPSASAPVMPAAKATPTTVSAAPVDETAINTRAQLSTAKHRQDAPAKPQPRRGPVEEVATPAPPPTIEPSATPPLTQATPEPLPSALAPASEAAAYDTGDDIFGSPALLTAGEAAILPDDVGADEAPTTAAHV